MVSSSTSETSHVPTLPDSAPDAVFISYAREDTGAARRIAEALLSHGVEVWFDQSELRGGDAWDQKIRKQINECSLFLPIISQHTPCRRAAWRWRGPGRWVILPDLTPMVLPKL